MLLTALALSLIISITVPPLRVYAAGAPKVDYVPDIPTNDPAHDEKVPSVSFMLKRPSAQTSGGFPTVIAELSGMSASDEHAVTENDKWYLDVDINTPGWLYIYEYYPPNNYLPGQWLAYKWRMEQSGGWRIGPFTASEGEIEGQHVYRLWFYGNDLWAKTGESLTWSYQSAKIITFDVQPRNVPYGENVTVSWDVSGTDKITITPLLAQVTARNGMTVLAYDQLKSAISENNTVNFSISATGKGGIELIKRRLITLEPRPQEPATPLTSPTTAENLSATHPNQEIMLTDSIFIIGGLSLAAVLAVAGLLIARKRSERLAYKHVPNPDSLASPAGVTLTPEIVRAKLATAEAFEILLDSGSRSIGRKDLVRVLEPDQLILISKRHFMITFSGEQYSISDMDSVNGTRVNGTYIRGKGPWPLNNGDIIQLPGSVNLHFHLC